MVTAYPPGGGIALPRAIGNFLTEMNSTEVPYYVANYVEGHLHINVELLQWIVVIAAAFLLALEHTEWRSDILTALLIPVIAINLPGSIMGFLRGEIGHWLAFILVILRLFFHEHIPRELEYPAALLLLCVTAPSHVVALRSSVLAQIVCLLIGIWIAYQHSTAAGDVGSTLTRGRHMPVTIAIIALIAVPAIILIQAF